MAELYFTEDSPQHVCWDRKFYNTFDDQLKVLATSKTVYVGNLSFFTTEEQINETFSTVGPIKRIIMGLNQITKTPCGFCFVEYFTRDQASACLKFVSGTVCDDRIIRCDMDGGFRPGRQYGRGASGGQVRDDRIASYDPARGGGSSLKTQRPPPVAFTGKRGRNSENYNNNDGINRDPFGRDHRDNRGQNNRKNAMSQALSTSRQPAPSNKRKNEEIEVEEDDQTEMVMF